MLGGSHFQIPAIKYARDAGYYVITADYLPDNPGHQYAHEYHNVSTIDKETVLGLARRLKIQGIVSYASDPGAPTAAYVAEKLSLPGNPYESVLLLQRKDLFRAFLKNNGYNVPESMSFTDVKLAKEYGIQILNNGSIIVKPSDSSGSKGVTRIVDVNNIESALQHALKYSTNKIVVVEEFIEKAIYEMDGDGFVWQGKLAFACFGNQHNDLACNPYVPSGISFPYIQDSALQKKAFGIVESILRKLDMRVGGLNIEYLTDQTGEIYILEIGPRSGGNLIPEVIKYATGVDLIAASIDGAMGADCCEMTMIKPRGFYSSYILHSQQAGVVKSIYIDPDLEGNIIEKNIIVKEGDFVEKFDGSNNTLGTFILKFDDQEKMVTYLDNMSEYINVKLA